jgi:ABC-type transporter MlaC component
MKKILITLSLLMPFFACHSTMTMQEFQDKQMREINERYDRLANDRARADQERTNQAIQNYLSPLNNINRNGYR